MGFCAVVHLILRLGRGILGHPVVHAVVGGVTQAWHHTEVFIFYESMLAQEIIRRVRSRRGKAKGRIRTESDMPAVEPELFQKALGECIAAVNEIGRLKNGCLEVVQVVVGHAFDLLRELLERSAFPIPGLHRAGGVHGDTEKHAGLAGFFVPHRQIVSHDQARRGTMHIDVAFRKCTAQSLAIRLALFVQRSLGQSNLGVAGSEFFPNATVNVKRPKGNRDVRRIFPKNLQESKGVADVADIDGLPGGTKKEMQFC